MSRRAIFHPIKAATKRTLNSFGYELTRAGNTSKPDDFQGEFPVDFDPETVATIRRVLPYTMTPPERLFALCDAVRYVVDRRIPGDIVECGVWRGGSMMAAALALLERGDTTRTLYLYDTFEGMTKPSSEDVDFAGVAALDDWNRNRANPFYTPARAGLDEVESAMSSTGYPMAAVRFVKGPVETTIPSVVPENIALLRLDTDWYESTAHEMKHLFPLLAPGGVLIVDDYGHFQGARKAVDEYLSEQQEPLLLVRVDYSCRMGVRTVLPA